MAEVTNEPGYVNRYRAERKRVAQKATFITETGDWGLYEEQTAPSPFEWRTFIAVRSTPPTDASDSGIFRLGHNGQRWENRRSLNHLTTVYAEMLAAWDLHLRAVWRTLDR